jgi:hypothetical protein
LRTGSWASVVGLGLVGAEHVKAYVANPSYQIVAFVSRDKGTVVD